MSHQSRSGFRFYPREVAVNAVHFDGTTPDYLDGNALTGISDGKVFTFSLWFNRNAYAGAQRFVHSVGGAFDIRIRTSPEDIIVQADNASATEILSAHSVTEFGSGNSGWHHVLIAADLASSIFEMYIDDVDDSPTVDTITNDTIDFTTAENAVGGAVNGSQPMNGDFAELWFDTSFLDITVTANRRKFISRNLKPVDLGSDGSTPTGSQPIVYLGNATATWQNNLGSGGNYTENGALTDAASSPSD